MKLPLFVKSERIPRRFSTPGKSIEERWHSLNGENFLELERAVHCLRVGLENVNGLTKAMPGAPLSPLSRHFAKRLKWDSSTYLQPLVPFIVLESFTVLPTPRTPIHPPSFMPTRPPAQLAATIPSVPGLHQSPVLPSNGEESLRRLGKQVDSLGGPSGSLRRT